MPSTRTTTPCPARCAPCSARSGKFNPRTARPHGASTQRVPKPYRSGQPLGILHRAEPRRNPGKSGLLWLVPAFVATPQHQHTARVLRTFGSVMTHEPTPQRDIDAGFNWDTVKVRLSREFDPSIPPSAVALWDRLYKDDQSRDALQEILLQASVLTPPLYVGKTDNLRRRYNHHTASPTLHANTFHRRFAECARQFDLGLSVSDLIFVCIRTGRDVEDKLSAAADTQEINSLLEEILKRLCRPPFSNR